MFIALSASGLPSSVRSDIHQMPLLTELGKFLPAFYKHFAPLGLEI
jgi:hypothetical protein